MTSLLPASGRLRGLARLLSGPGACAALAVAAAGLADRLPAQTAPAAAGDEAATAAAGERLKLTTSDDVALAAWFYPAAESEEEAGPGDDAKVPVVILLHDLDGSHESVEPLAQALRSAGMAVVAPDLRGHGATKVPEGKGANDSKSLKKPDFERMVVTSVGRVREQAANRGDIETLRNWIRDNADKHRLDPEKLIVVGSGVGAAVGAQWTVLDANWPDLASGPQGRHVRGLVLVSPAWTTRGFTISPALAAEPVRKTLPVLVIGGTPDSDAVKIYDQLKRQRPDSWSEKRTGQPAPTQAAKLGADDRPSLYLRQFDTALSGDRLAAYVPKDPRAGGHPAALIKGFIEAITAE